MDKLKAAQEAVLAVNQILNSFQFLHPESPRTHTYIQAIKDVLPLDFSSTEMRIPNVQNNHAEINILERVLTKTKELQTDEQAFDSLENDLNLQLLRLVASYVELIITGSSGAITNEYDKASGPSISSKLLTESGIPSKKRKFSSSDLEEANNEIKELHSPETPVEKPFAEQALENDVVLLQIFRHSSPRDLQNFRLVNRKWNDTSTSTLLIKKSHHLVVGCRDELFPLYQNWSCNAVSGSDPDSLEILCNLIENAPKFPTKSILFQNGCIENDLQVLKFLSVYGSELREISFAKQCSLSFSFLRNLLETHCPKLETLNIRSSLLMGNTSNSNLGPLGILPHLKHLHFQANEDVLAGVDPVKYTMALDFFQELLQASVNLQSVYNYVFDFLEKVMDSNRVDVIKRLLFEPNEKRPVVGGNNISIFQKLEGMKPRLSKLEIWMGYLFEDEILDFTRTSNAISALNSILNSSKDTLKTLKIQPLGILELRGIELPQLSSVKQLTVTDEGVADAIFPARFSFSHHLPNLQFVKLRLCSYINSAIVSYFCQDGRNPVCSSVKYLELRGDIFNKNASILDSEYEGAHMLATMFPNVESLKVVYYRHNKLKAHHLNPILWHLCPKGLKYLSITGLQCSYDSSWDDTVHLVDSFFTGIPVDICKKLRDWPDKIGFQKEGNNQGQQNCLLLNVIRTKKSVCDLKDLKELNLCFYNCQSGAPFASHVSALYGFGLLPQLEVTLIYEPNIWNEGKNAPINLMSTSIEVSDMNKSFALINPYVRTRCAKKSYPQ